MNTVGGANDPIKKKNCMLPGLMRHVAHQHAGSSLTRTHFVATDTVKCANPACRVLRRAGTRSYSLRTSYIRQTCTCGETRSWCQLARALQTMRQWTLMYFHIGTSLAPRLTRPCLNPSRSACVTCLTPCCTSRTVMTTIVAQCWNGVGGGSLTPCCWTLSFRQ